MLTIAFGLDTCQLGSSVIVDDSFDLSLSASDTRLTDDRNPLALLHHSGNLLAVKNPCAVGGPEGWH